MYSSTIFALTQLIAEMREWPLVILNNAHSSLAYSLICAVAFFLLL